MHIKPYIEVNAYKSCISYLLYIYTLYYILRVSVFLFESVMYPLTKLDCNAETKPGPKRTSMNTETTNREEKMKHPTSASHRPKSIMVVHSTPSGDQIQCETYSINVRI